MQPTCRPTEGARRGEHGDRVSGTRSVRRCTPGGHQGVLLAFWASAALDAVVGNQMKPSTSGINSGAMGWRWFAG